MWGQRGSTRQSVGSLLWVSATSYPTDPDCGLPDSESVGPLPAMRERVTSSGGTKVRRQ